MHTRHWVPVKALWLGQKGTRQFDEGNSGQAAPVRTRKGSWYVSLPPPPGVCSPRWTLVAGIKIYAPVLFQLQVHNASPTAPTPQHYIQSICEWVERARVSICFFRVCYLWLADMDAWREELNVGLARAFRDDD